MSNDHGTAVVRAYADVECETKVIHWSAQLAQTLKPASRCPIMTESEGTQSVDKSDEIFSDCFCPIISIPLPDCRSKFLSN